MHSSHLARIIDFNYVSLMHELSEELKKLPYASKERLSRLLKYIYTAGLCEEEDVSVIEPYYDHLRDRIYPECDVLVLAKEFIGVS